MNRIQKVSAATFFIFYALSPASASAAVQITEIMYDVSGSDSGREWIEITNMGDSPADVSGYKLFEANTNHALALISGSAVLLPGASAVLADDAAKFKADWPSYADALFDSSFSLSNSGETLAIKNSALEVEDSVTYDPAVGAGGDGNTLQRSGSSFAAAAPTPGAFTSDASGAAGGEDAAGSPASDVEAATTTSASATSGQGPPPITLTVRADASVMVGGGSFFEAKAYGTKGVPLLDARVLWNFGDGTTAEGSRVFHAYSYPGTYAVTASAAYNYSFAMQRVRVEAVAAEVALRAEADGSLTVVDESQKDIDIGYWSLYENGRSFVIPADTIVYAGEGVRFSPSVTGISADTQALLRYPNEAVAASAAPGATSPLRGERVPAEQLQTLNAPLIDVPAGVDINAPALPAEEATDTLQSAAAAQSGSMALWESLAGLGVLLSAGIAATYYARPARRGAETSLSAEEFEIE